MKCPKCGCAVFGQHDDVLPYCDDCINVVIAEQTQEKRIRPAPIPMTPTPTGIEALLCELGALRERATPGVWSSDHVGEHSGHGDMLRHAAIGSTGRTLFDTLNAGEREITTNPDDDGGVYYTDPIGQANVELVVALVNALPELTAALRSQSRALAEREETIGELLKVLRVVSGPQRSEECTKCGGDGFDMTLDGPVPCWRCGGEGNVIPVPAFDVQHAARVYAATTEALASAPKGADNCANCGEVAAAHEPGFGGLGCPTGGTFWRESSAPKGEGEGTT